MKFREKFLTEKCINTLVYDYRHSDDYHSALQDFRIEFCAFLSQNEEEYVNYGIEYFQEHYPEEIELMLPIILEYREHGTKGALEWSPIPGKDDEDCEIEDVTEYQIDEQDCTFKEKIVLFVMKLLRM